MCCQRRGFLPTLVVMFRDTLAFIHTMLTNQEAASLCLSEIVTHRLMWPIFQCHAYYEFSVVRISLSNNCTVIIIGVYRPPDKSKIPEFTIKLNEILSSTSQSDHVFIVGDLNIKGKGKVFYGQEHPSGESTTTECGFNYQLLAVIY